jgi:predicted Rossmann-fold nucleotide-binding protein
MRATSDRILRRRAYRAPSHSYSEDLLDLLARLGRDARSEGGLFRDAYRNRATTVFCAGDLGILDQPAVSIVGTREVSEAGWGQAARLARDLANRGVTVVSGLAKGVDTAALTSATSNGGRVAAVIGTPLDKAYPVENSELQQQIPRAIF